MRSPEKLEEPQRRWPSISPRAVQVTVPSAAPSSVPEPSLTYGDEVDWTVDKGKDMKKKEKKISLTAPSAMRFCFVATLSIHIPLRHSHSTRINQRTTHGLKSCILFDTLYSVSESSAFQRLPPPPTLPGATVAVSRFSDDKAVTEKINKRAKK